jgi:hypothetical protein
VKNGQVLLQEELQIKFGKMTREQLEILNRVKLLMGYDSEKTLKENYQIILKEQPNISVMDLNYPLQAGLWLNRNSGDITTKEFKDTWRNYIIGTRNLSLQNLLNLSKQLADNGYGPISPGLYGFNKPNAGVANIPIENQIYVLKLNQYNKDKKAYDEDPKGKLVPVKPTPPQYNLLPLQTSTRANGLMGKINNIPKQVMSFLEPTKTQGQGQQQAGPPNTPFQNQTQSDEFRLWLLSNYPEYGTKPKPYNVDLTSKYTNSTALKQAYKEKGKEYETFMSQRGGLDYKPKFIKSDATSTSVGKGFNPEAKAFNIEDYDAKQYKEYADRILSKYNFSTFPTPISDYMGKPKYEENSWREPNTGEVFSIQGKTLDQIQKEIISKFEFKQKSKAEEELLSNDKLVQIFGKKTIQDEMNNTDCDTESKLAFFQDVLDNPGKYTDSKGNKIGTYVIENGVSRFVSWPTDKPIPCVDMFWQENGWWIQMGGMVLISYLAPTFGLPRLATMLIELAADTTLNIYSLKKNTEAQDEDAMMLDVVFTILPFAMMSPIIKGLLKSAKFGDEVIRSVETKFKSLPNGASTPDVKNLVGNMTPEEQRLVKELGKQEHASKLSQVGQDVINDLTKGASAPMARKVAEPLITLFIYGLPVGGYAFKQYQKIKATLEKEGISLTESEEKTWEMALSIVKDAEALASNKEKIMQIQNSPKYKKAEQKVNEAKKLANELGVDTVEEAQEATEQVNKIFEAFNELDNMLKSLGIETKPIQEN